MNIAFIFGSPRSGTTILGNILNTHSEIAEWYEPYFLWEKYFSCRESDVWSKKDLNDTVKANISKEYSSYYKKAGKPVIVEKSPGHEYNIEIITEIFPDAKWIHMLRDGRDVTLSIRKEWDRRRLMVQQKDFKSLLRVTVDMLRRQPFWEYRFKAILHELSSIASVNPLKYLNKSRWMGEVGWGNRFEGWREYLQEHSSLEFNAMQWVKSIDAVSETWPLLEEKNRIEIRYENLLESPKENLEKILKFLGVDISEEFFQKIPVLKRGNFNKWSKEFTPEELKEISPTLTEKLIALGYEDDLQWADQRLEQVTGK
ncbi:sulfotransferase [Thermodesulfobacteriota bacterium]